MDLISESQKGNIENIKKLLLNGADLNHQNLSGTTALIWASCQDHLEIVKLLLLNGADPNIKDDRGKTALYWASYFGRLKVVKLLTRGTKMKEWRPWNHCNLSSQYQDAMSTLLLLAKIKMNYNRLFNTITI